jgi:hypothetical protein
MGKCLSPFLLSSRHPDLFTMCLFSVACLLFSFFFCFVLFFAMQGSVCPGGLCLFIPRVAVEIPIAAYLLTCWSASSKQVRSWCLAAWELPWFLCISWFGEAMCRLGVWRCQSFASSWWFLMPGVSPASQQDFYFKEHTLAHPSSSCHLGSSSIILLD